MHEIVGGLGDGLGLDVTPARHVIQTVQVCHLRRGAVTVVQAVHDDRGLRDVPTARRWLDLHLAQGLAVLQGHGDDGDHRAGRRQARLVVLRDLIELVIPRLFLRGYAGLLVREDVLHPLNAVGVIGARVRGRYQRLRGRHRVLR